MENVLQKIRKTDQSQTFRKYFFPQMDCATVCILKLDMCQRPFLTREQIAE
jgi:hypothetical protein